MLCWWGWVARATLFRQGFPCCSLLLQDPLCKKAHEEQCAVNQLLFLLEKSAGPWMWSQHTRAVALGVKSLLLVSPFPLPGGRAEGPVLPYSGYSGTHTKHFIPRDIIPEAFLHGSVVSAFLALDPCLYSPIPTPAWDKQRFAAWALWTCTVLSTKPDTSVLGQWIHLPGMMTSMHHPQDSWSSIESASLL